MDRDALRELLAKVEAGEAPNDTRAIGDINYDAQGFLHGAYNGSLDAAKALMDALLPAPLFQWHLSNEVNFDGFVVSIFGCRQDRYLATSHNADPARAWLCSILKALIAEGE